MDIFKSLTTGLGSGFDRKRFGADMDLFSPRGKDRTGASSAFATSDRKKRKRGVGGSTQERLPEELDFFGDQKGKARAVEEEEEDGEGTVDERAEESGDEEKEVVITKANVASYLRRHKIKQTGTDVPMPLVGSAWQNLKERWGVEDYLIDNLVRFGWKHPTAVQRGAMPVMLDNRDALVGAPTGSGKTLTYLLPLLHHLGAPAKKEGYRAVVVCPTNELATQIHEQLRRLGDGRKWKINVLTKPTQAEKNQKQEASKKKYDVLITTPLRLVHAIEEEEVDLSAVRYLVLDEADRLLDEGFLQQTDSILAACTHPQLRKALTSATLPSGIEELAKTFMVDECRILVGKKDGAVETVDQELMYVASEEGKLLGLRSLVQRGELKPPVLIFVQSIQRAQELFKELVYDGVHVDVIHGDRPRSQREAVVSAFKKGQVWVLICTEVLARGIDFKGVNLVINYDFPQSVQSYIHRIGRTGRAGRKGKAVTFFAREDATHLKAVVNVMRQSGCEVPEWMVKLPNASKKEKKKLKKAAPKREAVKVAAGSVPGKNDKAKRKAIVEASSKRRKTEAEQEDSE